MISTVRFDFETRSKVSLMKVGSWAYSRHPSTEVMCLTWKASNGLMGHWHREHPGVPETPAPTILFRLIRDGQVVIEAHNAMFEHCIWMNVCVPRMGWPEVPDEFWRCSAAKAAACALPRALGDCGNALSLSIVKDEANGKRILQKVSKPAKPTKAFPDRKWHEELEDLQVLWEYNKTDVLAEEAISDVLPPLSPYEQKIWEMDQRMNLRGFAVDVEGATKAIRLADKWTIQLNEHLAFLTNDQVDAGTKRGKALTWLQDRGVDIYDTQGPTLDHMIAKLERENVMPAERRVMEIVRSTGRTSNKKYQSMLLRADIDARIRDSMMYHGAGTGRWAGKGVQPHNFPRGGLKNMEQAWEVIHDEDLEMIQLLYGDPMKLLSDALRGAIWAPEGRRLYCADYAAIEARVLLWLAGDEDGLNIFRGGEDIYLEMASTIYGKKMTKKDVEARQLGKQAILGLGFGMGFIKFLVTCRLWNMHFTTEFVKSIVPPGWYQATGKWIVEEAWDNVERMLEDASERDIPELILMKYIVDKYRSRFRIVQASWYDIERVAISAVNDPGKTYSSMRTNWTYETKHFPVLKCELPSGRFLYYPYAEVRVVKKEQTKKEKESGKKAERAPKLTYMGIDARTHQWVRIGTYGGKLAENITQATARDVMADAMLRCDQGGVYDVIMSVHDEVVCETDENEGSLEEFISIVSANPAWALDCPIKAEGWTGRRYRK